MIYLLKVSLQMPGAASGRGGEWLSFKQLEHGTPLTCVDTFIYKLWGETDDGTRKAIQIGLLDTSQAHEDERDHL